MDYSFSWILHLASWVADQLAKQGAFVRLIVGILYHLDSMACFFDICGLSFFSPFVLILISGFASFGRICHPS